ncbi:MAG: hypothetical protein FWH40_09400 [Coriobacteriia bacterium]|nr:hypothetical protein [Coriobacteriia bacterium]
MAQTRDVDFNKRATEFDEGIEGRASQRFYNLLLREVELRPKQQSWMSAAEPVRCSAGSQPLATS